MDPNFKELSLASEAGPFDIIGDVHGCYPELLALLSKLGWRDLEGYTASTLGYNNAGNTRKVVFLGDLTDRGPNSAGVLRLVMGMVMSGQAMCLKGNHDDKLARKLAGRKVRVGNGLETTLTELSAEPPEFVDQVRDFLRGLVSYYVLDEGRLVVAHAGIKDGYDREERRQGSGFYPLRRYDGRNGRAGPARSPRLGRRLSWRCNDSIWAYPRIRTEVGAQYYQHRHRLRIWRQADCLALP